MRKRLALLALLAALPAGPALGRDRFAADGAALRLLAEPPGADGRFRAALLVDLAPGWKTYWLAPGDSGIPPSLAFAKALGATAAFPAPHRLPDDFGTSNVYSAPFAVALEGRADPGAAGLAVKATLGLCRDICVPVAADLDAAFAADSETRQAVDAAFAALPRESSAANGIVDAALAADGRSLTLTVRPPALAAGADLFAAAPGWTFGAPRPAAAGESGTARLVLPVEGRPRKGADAPFTVEAVLAGPAGAWRASGLPVARER